MSGSQPTRDRAAVAIPNALDEVLSPAWLTAALGQRFPGIEVVAVTPGPIVQRLSTNARFTIECRDRMPDGLSAHLCVKGYFGDLGDLGVLMRRVGQPEAYFYRDLAAVSGVRTLRAVYADVDPETEHGVIITEDVIAQGARFLDGRDELTVDQLADGLAQLAHAACRDMGAVRPREPTVAGAAARTDAATPRCCRDPRQLRWADRRGRARGSA